MDKQWVPRASGVSRYARGLVLSEMRALVPIMKAYTPSDTGALRRSVDVRSYYDRRTRGLKAHVGWYATDGGFQKHPVRVQQMLAAAYGNSFQPAFGRRAFEAVNGTLDSTANRVERKFVGRFERDLKTAARAFGLSFTSL